MLDIETQAKDRPANHIDDQVNNWVCIQRQMAAILTAAPFPSLPPEEALQAQESAVKEKARNRKQVHIAALP